MTDERLQTIVMEELQWDPKLDGSEIGVLVEGHVVTLKGHVRSYAEKTEAEKAVKRLSNVQAVANNLEVRLPSAWVRDDEKIAGAALSALAWRWDVPENSVKVVVENGWVRLEGEVDWDFQRKAAEKAVHKLIGVRGVSNLLRVKARVQPKDVRERIEAALKRDAMLEAARLDVSVDGGKVVLRGNVHSWAERTRAENSAWSAPGVIEVVNHLTVAPYVFA
jgi:osmotically-inducible protein OsmY